MGHQKTLVLQEEPLELTLEVGGEDLLADGGMDLFERPEAAAVEF